MTPRALRPAAKARELSFLADKFSAEEAQRFGLVARVWNDDRFQSEWGAMAARLAARSPAALLAMKAHYVAAERLGLADFITLETEKHGRIRQLEDTAEAFRAFVEKRAPKFTGR
jgi:2-(1,2-epoxy-1,2-dihydrophenyl)acetyl-CoA isomerase